MAIRGLHPGLERTAGIGLKMFSNDELEKIHLATLDVLWNVGVKVESQEAIQFFDGGGCTINNNSGIVRIPAHLVEDSIRLCPPIFRACGRDASKDFICEKDRVGFVNFGEAPQMIESVGPGGEYITHEHTYNNMKQQSQVDLFDRNTRDVWEERGSKDIVEKSYEKAFDILRNHKPEPLPGNVQISLNEIFKEAETRVENQAN